MSLGLEVTKKDAPGQQNRWTSGRYGASSIPQRLPEELEAETGQRDPLYSLSVFKKEQRKIKAVPGKGASDKRCTDYAHGWEDGFCSMDPWPEPYLFKNMDCPCFYLQVSRYDSFQESRQRKWHVSKANRERGGEEGQALVPPVLRQENQVEGRPRESNQSF